MKQTSLTRNANDAAKRSADVLGVVTGAFQSTDKDHWLRPDATAKKVLFNAQKAIDNNDLDFLAKAEFSLALATSFISIGCMTMRSIQHNVALKFGHVSLESKTRKL